jgi:Peptidase M76 family
MGPSEERSKAKPACHHCVQLLQDLFSRPTHQASRLLYNMLHAPSLPSSSTEPSPSFDTVVRNHVQTLPDGIRIRIPTATDTSSKAAMATASDNNSSSNNNNKMDSSTLIRRLSYNDVPPRPRTADDDDWIQVTCRRCSDFGPEANARAFVMGPSPLSIVVCQNRILPPYPNNSHANTATTTHLQKRLEEMDEIVTHELIHIYDVRTLKLDLLQCSDLAYSEIRAAREAECSSLRRSLAADDEARTLSSNIRPRWSLLSTSAATNSNTTYADKMQHQRHDALEQCVRSRATTATQNLFATDQAQCCIQQVFARVMADERPSRSSGEHRGSCFNTRESTDTL